MRTFCCTFWKRYYPTNRTKIFIAIIITSSHSTWTKCWLLINLLARKQYSPLILTSRRLSRNILWKHMMSMKRSLACLLANKHSILKLSLWDILPYSIMDIQPLSTLIDSTIMASSTKEWTLTTKKYSQLEWIKWTGMISTKLTTPGQQLHKQRNSKKMWRSWSFSAYKIFHWQKLPIGITTFGQFYLEFNMKESILKHLQLLWEECLLKWSRKFQSLFNVLQDNLISSRFL